MLAKEFWLRAFAFCELSIPLALIAFTIAIPTLFRSVKPANEATAVANLREVIEAEADYLASTGHYGTAMQLVESGLLDSRFLGSTSGYDFSIVVDSGSYGATATPVSDNTGRYEYYSTPEGFARFSLNTSKAPPGQAGNPVY